MRETKPLHTYNLQKKTKQKHNYYDYWTICHRHCEAICQKAMTGASLVDFLLHYLELEDELVELSSAQWGEELMWLS